MCGRFPAKTKWIFLVRKGSRGRDLVRYGGRPGDRGVSAAGAENAGLGGSVRVCKNVKEFFRTLCTRLVPLLQRLRALLGLENKAVRADAQKAGVELLPVPVSAVIETDKAAWADAALLSPSVSAYNGIFALFGFRTGEGELPVEVKPNSRYRDEQYKLSVTKSGVTVTAAGERKVFI